MSRSGLNRDSVASARTVANMMRFIQALRRSIKGEKDKGPQVSIAPKSAVAIVPPKKVSPIVRPPCRVRFLCPVVRQDATCAGRLLDFHADARDIL